MAVLTLINSHDQLKLKPNARAAMTDPDNRLSEYLTHQSTKPSSPQAMYRILLPQEIIVYMTRDRQGPADCTNQVSPHHGAVLR